MKVCMAAAMIAVGVMAAMPALADVQEDEVAELRQMLRQQAAVMQAMQRRLDAMEARQSTRAATSGPSGMNSLAAGTRIPKSRPATSSPAQVATGSAGASGGDAGIRPSTPEGRPELEAQRNTPDSGTVNASPRQEAARTAQATAPTAGNPPLPVLSGNDRVQVTLSGQVNRMVLFHNDGSGRTATYFADNNVSSTRLRMLGSAKVDNDTVAVSAIEFDLRSNSSAAVTRQSSNNNGGDTPILGPFRVRRAEVGVQSEYGSVLLGRGSTFTDGIAEFDLSGTDVALYSYLPDTAGSLQFSNRNGVQRRAGDPTISQVFDDFDGPRDDRIRYDSPTWHGITIGGSVGQGGFADVGLRYAAIISGARVAAGIGYMNYQGTLPSMQPQDGTDQATTPFKQRMSGSAAVLLPNGLNLLLSAGWGNHYSGCCATGLVARDTATTYFIKAGYQAHIFNFGLTNFAIQGGQTRNRINDGDIASRIGLSFEQQVIAKGIELYGGYEHLTLYRPGAQRFAPSDLALLGSRVQF
jgi:hypothetical protein